VARNRGAKGQSGVSSARPIVQVIKPFVLLDLFRLEPSAPMLFKLHPHSGIARSPC
jgi:redox-sensitive bicupin YhaK (pirin superfamily)